MTKKQLHRSPGWRQAYGTVASKLKAGGTLGECDNFKIK